LTIGAYVLEMPVTIPQARAAGREIWGFPKFETKIPFKLERKRFEFGVLDRKPAKISFKSRPHLWRNPDACIRPRHLLQLELQDRQNDY